MRVFISNKAEADLLQLFSYFSERDRIAADTIAAEINNKFESLVRFPFIGRARSSLAPGHAKRCRGDACDLLRGGA